MFPHPRAKSRCERNRRNENTGEWANVRASMRVRDTQAGGVPVQTGEGEAQTMYQIRIEYASNGTKPSRHEGIATSARKGCCAVVSDRTAERQSGVSYVWVNLTVSGCDNPTGAELVSQSSESPLVAVAWRIKHAHATCYIYKHNGIPISRKQACCFTARVLVR